ncbi:MAG: Type 1 glutamine amidotransferase-like domain-containing protein [Oscillospiraceae bacterium]|nr:Type 1 glutamine amidotransferase-like domain-containing protein [Oscillospiraceae bacterium]
MKYFLTSSHCPPDSPRLYRENGFSEMLKNALGNNPLDILFIASSLDDTGKNDMYGDWEKDRFADEGYDINSFTILDSRNADSAAELVKNCNFIILSGGHVPTQNEFFDRINLAQLIKDFDGVVMGISAGSMNSAATVYAQPELQGEATDPLYQKFIPGLGLTETNILPHYNMVKNDVIDGLRLFEDVTFADSMGRQFLVLPDGSFVYGDGKSEKLCGSGYILADGVMTAVKDIMIKQ